MRREVYEGLVLVLCDSGLRRYLYHGASQLILSSVIIIIIIIIITDVLAFSNFGKAGYQSARRRSECG